MCFNHFNGEQEITKILSASGVFIQSTYDGKCHQYILGNTHLMLFVSQCVSVWFVFEVDVFDLCAFSSLSPSHASCLIYSTGLVIRSGH